MKNVLIDLLRSKDKSIETALTQLAKTVQESKEITDNGERIKYIENSLAMKSLISDNPENLRKKKNDEIAKNERVDGNKHYGTRRFIDALEKYNKSLCFSQTKECMGLAYANRSAVYIELKLYSVALKDIEAALCHNYPVERIDKLKKREEFCKRMIDENVKEPIDQPIGLEFLKINRKLNPKLPFIADCLELKTNEQFGKHIVTTEALSAGTIICIEEPFSKCLRPIGCYAHCANCLDNNFFNLTPCRHCTVTMFCSEKCHEIGWKKFHQYDCSVIDKLNSIATKTSRLCIYTFFEALYAFNSNIDELKCAMDENENSPMTIFDLDLSRNRDEKKMFMVTDSFMKNDTNSSSKDEIERSETTALLTHLFLNYTKLKDILVTDADKDFYRHFIMKQLKISPIYYHTISREITKKSEIETVEPVGSGNYPFSALINHSCEPNLVRVTLKCKNIYLTIRPIKAGEQLFDNYGYHHCLENLQERQSSLKDQYMFECTCNACVFDYPLYAQLKNVTNLCLDLYASGEMDRIMDLDFNTAKKCINKFCKHLNNLDKKYPCFEISTLQECLLRCYKIFKMSEFNMELIKCGN